MEDRTADLELRERLGLIESMIAEGRSTTERWGWAFVVWGVVYIAAIGWSTKISNGWPWLVCVAVGLLVTGVGASFRVRRRPVTILGRAIGSIWIGLSVSMTVLFTTLGVTGRLVDQHVSVAMAAAMLGLANGASGMVLHWKPQITCAVVWWAAAVAACFGSEEQCGIVFIAAIFFCQIVFGIYAMVAEARKQAGLSHA